MVNFIELGRENSKSFNITETLTYTILSAIADSLFYFLPVFLAITVARKFKDNVFVAVTIARALV